jgi:hypothetical protein
VWCATDDKCACNWSNGFFWWGNFTGDMCKEGQYSPSIRV